MSEDRAQLLQTDGLYLVYEEGEVSTHSISEQHQSPSVSEDLMCIEIGQWLSQSYNSQHVCRGRLGNICLRQLESHRLENTEIGQGNFKEGFPGEDFL